jgi:subtilase family serine protease
LGYKYHPSGGWGAIALVDAYDNPNAASDLAYFSTYWGLAAPKFTKVYANTSYGTLNGLTASCSGVPPANVGWGLEEALDIQWAHVMAPSAKIYLVEACSAYYSDLLFAEEVASSLVTAAGGGDISNSWSGGESASQLGTTGYDNHFYREDALGKPITYFASTGDWGYGMCGPSCTGPAYPATNPWVVAVGGTTINRDSAGNFLSESCWSGSGGGYSAYEMWRDPNAYGSNIIFNSMGGWTPYQYPLFTGYPYTSAPRAMPDIAANADPASGVWVYDTYGYGGWVIVGGTSASSPIIAGIVNSANNRLGMRGRTGIYHSAELNMLYSQLQTYTAYKTNFYDVTTGSNGVSAGVGHDLCTGIGTPRGKLGK